MTPAVVAACAAAWLAVVALALLGNRRLQRARAEWDAHVRDALDVIEDE